MATKFHSGIDNGGQRGLNFSDPSSASDAATKQYVDNVALGLRWKNPVRAATTVNGTLATAFENGDTIDGITLATNDRILLKNQTDAKENGIYVVQASGAPVRATDADSTSELNSATVMVMSGSVNADFLFTQTTDNPVIATDNIVWAQFTGGTSYTAGDGMTLTGFDFSVNVDSTTIEINSDTLRIAATAAGAGLIGGGGSALAVGAGSGITVNANDVALASSTGGAGLTYTTGVLAVGAGNGITVNADDVALASSVAGNALTYTSGVLDVAPGTGLEISSDTIRIAAAAAGAGLIGGAGSALAVGAGTGITVNADDVAIDTSYLDGVIDGKTHKKPVRAATTATITISNPGTAVFDGITLTSGERLLVKDQSTATQNGIYTFNGSSSALTRTTDADASAEVLSGMLVPVAEGTLSADTLWMLTTDGTITLGSTNLAFSRISVSASTAGNALTYTSGVLDVAVGAGLEISSDTVRIAAAAAGSGLTGGAGSALAVGAGNGITVNADDVALASSTGGAGLTFTTGVLAVGAGTGISVAADSVAIDTAVVVQKYAASIGDGSTTAIAVTHSLGTKDITWSLREVSGDVFNGGVDAVATSTTVLTLTFPTAPTTNQLRVVVHG